MVLSPFLVPITFLVVVAISLSLILRYKSQKDLLDSGLLDESTIDKLLQPQGLQREALKWALLLFFGGLGLVLLEFLPYRSADSPLPYGVEAICLSIGFSCYYLLVRRNNLR